MTHSSYARTNILVFLAVLALSALTMIWLFWHHPLKTTDRHHRGTGRARRVGAARALHRNRMATPSWISGERSI